MTVMDDVNEVVETTEEGDQFPQMLLEFGEIVYAFLQNTDYLLLLRVFVSF